MGKSRSSASPQVEWEKHSSRVMNKIGRKTSKQMASSAELILALDTNKKTASHRNDGELVKSKNTIPEVTGKRQFSLLVNDEVEQVLQLNGEQEPKKQSRRTSQNSNSNHMEEASDNDGSRRSQLNNSVVETNESALFIREHEIDENLPLSSTRVIKGMTKSVPRLKKRRHRPISIGLVRKET